jgi:predicted nuclease with TOPRIM domain
MSSQGVQQLDEILAYIQNLKKQYNELKNNLETETKNNININKGINEQLEKEKKKYNELRNEFDELVKEFQKLSEKILDVRKQTVSEVEMKVASDGRRRRRSKRKSPKRKSPKRK